MEVFEKNGYLVEKEEEEEHKAQPEPKPAPEPKPKAKPAPSYSKEAVLTWISVGVVGTIAAFIGLDAIFGFLPFIFPHWAMLSAYVTGAVFYVFGIFLSATDGETVGTVVCNAVFSICALGIFFGGIISIFWVNLIIGIAAAFASCAVRCG